MTEQINIGFLLSGGFGFAAFLTVIAEGSILFAGLCILAFLGWFFIFGLRNEVRKLKQNEDKIISLLLSHYDDTLKQRFVEYLENNGLGENLKRLQKAGISISSNEASRGVIQLQKLPATPKPPPPPPRSKVPPHSPIGRNVPPPEVPPPHYKGNDKVKAKQNDPTAKDWQMPPDSVTNIEKPDYKRKRDVFCINPDCQYFGGFPVNYPISVFCFTCKEHLPEGTKQELYNDYFQKELKKGR